jgi:hypothetical protein
MTREERIAKMHQRLSVLKPRTGNSNAYRPARGPVRLLRGGLGFRKLLRKNPANRLFPPLRYR